MKGVLPPPRQEARKEKAYVFAAIYMAARHHVPATMEACPAGGRRSARKAGGSPACRRPATMMPCPPAAAKESAQHGGSAAKAEDIGRKQVAQAGSAASERSRFRVSAAKRQVL